jgi:DNA repair protein RadC
MIYPRLIVESALRHKAAVVILSHNHPGGSAEPSLADIDITKKLAKALEIISVKVMDHIIVAGEKYLSMAEKRII